MFNIKSKRGRLEMLKRWYSDLSLEVAEEAKKCESDIYSSLLNELLNEIVERKIALDWKVLGIFLTEKELQKIFCILLKKESEFHQLQDEYFNWKRNGRVINDK